MISADAPVFPNNAVDIIATRLDMIDDELDATKRVRLFKRPLRSSDPAQSIGVFGVLWTPDEESLEMNGSLPDEPTIQQYAISVQAFVKDMDEERGLATHSVMSKMIRSVLYRDAPLRLGLSSLAVVMNDSTERTKRWGIRSTRYLSNEIDKQFIHLSIIDFWLDTETI